MKMIDPTYLRNIYDGLLSGIIHKDNASTLPIGLIGIYEDALPPSSNVNERKKFFEFFAVWALLKKEVSAAFVVPLLEGWTEEQVLYYIAEYSKWFNSPVSAKYVLYHERFRSFLLQKIAHGHFTACNEAIIQNCETALQTKFGDEWERYALEHLSLHLLIIAIETKDGAALKTLAYNTAHWNRQVEISKGFEWSKRMLNYVMLWASIYDEEEVIECALNQVDLHHMVQNDSPRIVELVKQNDIETALQSIEVFGGNDKEGLQRKFILYMLCLMELTLLDSKDKPYRKTAIEKILKHLDEQLPVNDSILNWENFFPSYAVYLMACKWAEMGLDYLIVYQRSDRLKMDWIKEKGLNTDLQFEILLESARGISDDFWKSRALKDISAELAKQGKSEESSSAMQEALEFARGISNDVKKSNALKDISAELAKQGKIVEALECARGIGSNLLKSEALKDISDGLAKQGKTKEALECARGISDDFWKSHALKDISSELAKQGKIVEALECARGISNDYEKSEALKDISDGLAKQGKTEEAASVMQEALECARGIGSNLLKSEALKDISTELAKQGKIEEALECARGIISLGIFDEAKSSALEDIFAELAIQGKIEEALECARGISDEYWKSSSLKLISTELAKQGKIEEALECARGISDDEAKSRALNVISTGLARQGNWSKAEQTGLEIPQFANRYTCWQTIARDACIKQGWQKALSQAHQFRNPESCRYYLKHLAQMVNLADCHSNHLLNALPNYQEDVESIETILYKHALHELFFEEASTVKINRFNRTLNLQWAIDIKNSISHN